MPSLPVQIVRFVDEQPQPGIVESQFRDAQGEVHSIIDKVPMFTGAVLWSDSEYPQAGFIECRVLERIPGPRGNLARITIEPYHVEWTDERSEFVISETDLLDRAMIGPSFAEVETFLADAARNYLVAEPNDRISEDENLRNVCRWLARWLRDMLSGEDGWGPYRSVDDILPCTSDRRSPTTLELTGLLIWMGDDSREWKEPLCAAIQLTGNSAAPLGYSVKVGDADRGLKRCPYSMVHDYPFVPVSHWLFTFPAPDKNEAQTQYQLVVQIKQVSSDDFNRLATWEDVVIGHLTPSAEVDGHDFGAGEFNLFIVTDDPSGTFHRIQGLPETESLLAKMAAAYRPVDGEDYVILWPPDSTRFKIA